MTVLCIVKSTLQLTTCHLNITLTNLPTGPGQVHGSGTLMHQSALVSPLLQEETIDL